MAHRSAWRIAKDQMHLAHDGPVPINRLIEVGEAQCSARNAQLAIVQQALSQDRVGLAKLRRRIGADRLYEESRLAEASLLIGDQRRRATRLVDAE